MLQFYYERSRQRSELNQKRAHRLGGLSWSCAPSRNQPFFFIGSGCCAASSLVGS